MKSISHLDTTGLKSKSVSYLLKVTTNLARPACQDITAFLEISSNFLEELSFQQKVDGPVSTLPQVQGPQAHHSSKDQETLLELLSSVSEGSAGTWDPENSL